MKAWIQRHQLISFFVLTYVIGTASELVFIFSFPGQPDHPWSLTWLFFAFSPSISAFIISLIIGGWGQVKQTFIGFTKWNINWRWYLAAAFLFLGPLTFALIYGAFGSPHAGIKPGMTIAILVGQFLFTLFSGPLSEEAGWRGFALPRLQQKYNALVSSLILGVIWCFWHLPLYFVPGSSQTGIPFPIYLMLVVTLSIYFAWLFNNSRGSLIITVLAHFSFNMSGGFIAGTLGLLPPMILYIVAGSMLVLVTVGVIFYFGARHLSRKPINEMPA